MRTPGSVLVRTPHQAERLARDGVVPEPLSRAVPRLALAGDARRPATGAEVWVATASALGASPPAAEADAERRAAAVAALDAAIGWLRRSGLDPARLGGLPRRVGVGARRVDELLGRAGLVDGRSLPGVARARAARGEVTHPSADVDGVVPADLDALLGIEALSVAARAHGGVRIALPRPTGERASALEPIADYLERRWAELPDAPEIAWLELPEREAERIEAPTPEAEAREIAARIADAVAAGCPPEEIAVAVPRADAALVGPLGVALADAGIPSSREGGADARDVPELAVALELLSMAAGRLTRDGLSDLLRTPGLHPGSWVAAPSEREAVRQAQRVAHRLREVPVAVDRARGERLVEALELVDPLASAAVARVAASLAPIGAARGRVAVIDAFTALVSRLRLGQPSAAELAETLAAEAASEGRRGARARLEAIAEGASAVRALQRTARALAEATRALGVDDAGEDAASVRAELAELTRRAGATLGGAPRAGAVRIATPRDLAGLRHRLLVIAGLSAGAYGAAEIRGLLDEDALSSLPPVEGRPPPIGARRAALELELRWLAGLAEQLVLTRCAGHGASDAEAPHPLFLGGSPRRAPASPLSPGARLASERGQLLRLVSQGRTPDAEPDRSLVLSARAAELERDAFFLDPRGRPGPHSGRLAAPAAELRARFGGAAADDPIPVTLLERAARCPFAAFGLRALRVRRIEDALEEATSRERGNLVHAALCAAFTALGALPPSASTGDRRAAAEAAARGATTRGGTPTPLRAETIRGVLRDTMAVVDADLESGEAAWFRAGEVGFGAPGDWPALSLDDPGGGAPLFVAGRIDRVDAPSDSRWVRVVDYKTGKLPRRTDEGVRALQLVLYAEAARRATPGLADAELRARYVSTGRAGVKVRDVEVDDEALGQAMGSARRAAAGLLSGEVGARPADPRACRRCEVRDLCRRPAIAATDDDGGDDADGEGAT